MGNSSVDSKQQQITKLKTTQKFKAWVGDTWRHGEVGGRQHRRIYGGVTRLRTAMETIAQENTAEVE